MTKKKKKKKKISRAVTVVILKNIALHDLNLTTI